MAQLSITATISTASYTINDVGSTDFALWGNATNPEGDPDSVTPVERKSGGGSLITLTATGGSSPLVYNDFRTRTWSGGTPDATGSNDRAIFLDPGTTAGYQIQVPADTGVSDLYIYIGAYQTNVCTISASLSDASAGPASDTTTFSGLNTTDQAAYGWARIRFQAGSGGQTLTVTVTATSTTLGYANVSIQAAGLSPVTDTTRGIPFGNIGTAFNGGRTLVGLLR